MIEEIQNKVIEYFQRSPKLRVLFFFDEHQEFKSIVEQYNDPNIKLVQWENNPFSLKVQLTTELKNEKVLLYLAMKQPTNQEEYQEFPLMGLLVANKALELDDTGAFIEDYGLGRHQKSLVDKYMSELKYSGVQEVCKPILKSEKLTEELLQQGILSAVLKFNQIQTWLVLIFRLSALVLNEKEYKRVFNKVNGLNMVQHILKQVSKLVDVNVNDLSINTLKTIAQALRYNQITQNIQEVSTSDPYQSLKTRDQEKIIQLNQLLFSIESDRYLSKQLDELFKVVDEDIQGEKITEAYDVNQEFAVYSEAMLWSVIAKSIKHLFTNPKDVFKQLEKLSLQDLSENVATVLSFLTQSAKLVSRIELVDSYLLNNPEEYINWYTNDGFVIDQTFRRCISNRKKIDDTEVPSQINLDAIITTVNDQYETHTDKLNREWLKCLSEKDFKYSDVNHPKQYDFFEKEIEHIDQKVVVIISDALRYEAGKELLAEMHGDPKNTAEMRSMLASMPSKTNIGMAQLLPGSDYVFNEGDVTIDGNSSSGTDNRKNILLNKKEESLAIQFSTCDGMKEKEAREIFRNKLVYVYHDVIDSTGDKKASEKRTFNAVKDAIAELKKFVKMLHSSYAVAKVFITSDHGFLYSDSSIEDRNLEKIPDVNTVLSHNRYFITKNEMEHDLGYSFPLANTTKFSDDVFVTIPSSTNRYRKQGVGHQFVHGGGSLQEVVIPLIESSRKLEKVVNSVMPQLVSNQNLRVVSNVLRFNVLQKEPISRNIKERTLSIGLYDDLLLVSNEEVKLLNFTSDSPSERMVKVELVLSPSAANKSFLKLKVFDVEDKLNALIDERVQNNTLIQQDF